MQANQAARKHPTKPLKIKDTPAEFINELLKHIAVVQIEIDNIQAKFKLSQNRDLVDFSGVIDGLTQTKQETLAQAMIRTK